jgi:Tfp pilus assembly protein PilN
MKHLPIDFAPRSPHAVLASVHPATWLIGAIALIGIASAAHKQIDLRRQEHAVALAAARVQATLAAHATRKVLPATAIPEPQARSVNTAVAQLNVPWRDLFDAVEAATPSTIALVAVEPNAGKHSIRLTAEAKTSEAMVAYIESLKRQPLFSSVTLTRHEVNAQDANRPFRFQLDAQWEARP